MEEDSAAVHEMRAIAAELLRAHRMDDQTAFLSAMHLAEGRVPDLLVSLCFIANFAMDQTITRTEADALIQRLVRDLPTPADHGSIKADTWLDAIALCEAVTKGDIAGGRIVISNSPDVVMLFGFVVQLMGMLLPTLPGEILDGLFAAARESEPPSVLGR